MTQKTTFYHTSRKEKILSSPLNFVHRSNLQTNKKKYKKKRNLFSSCQSFCFRKACSSKDEKSDVTAILLMSSYVKKEHLTLLQTTMVLMTRNHNLFFLFCRRFCDKFYRKNRGEK
eukprot:Pompholyxophrys_punicea_v1_NODE_42_length_4624_cov_10.963927.p5 type:complete len:116 gc:universal NODE_42_length_4624_cov_10.963927:3383-3730(+)